MTPSQSDLMGALARYLALRLARPELASVLWIGTASSTLHHSPLRRILRMSVNAADQATGQADLVGDLDKLPFRDQQFHGVIIDTQQTAMSDPRHAEQVYRVLHERAPLIMIGHMQETSTCIRHLYGLFRQRRWLSARVFCHRYQSWPMQRPTPWQNLFDTAASIDGLWLGTTRVSVFEKVTPPPPWPGLTQPLSQPIKSGMPTGSLAHAPVSRLATVASEPSEF